MKKGVIEEGIYAFLLNGIDLSLAVSFYALQEMLLKCVPFAVLRMKVDVDRISAVTLTCDLWNSRPI